ncbi:MAG: sulfatase-like hydrolase/transferase [Pseudomonadota bacterium]
MTRPPNVVWICMDQHPLANRGPLTTTLPLQARMADTGIRFTNAFTVLPICSPARASMLTGLYPHTHGVTENDGRFGGRPGLSPDDWTVRKAFAAGGYRTAWFGKWHLDNHSDAGRFGFEGWSLPGYGYPYAAPEYADCLDRHQLPEPVVEVELPGESLAPRGTRWSLRQLSDWPEFEAGALVLDGQAETHEAFFVADLARRWIRKHADEPFFVRVDPWGPHPPYMVPTDYQGRFPADTDLRPANFWSDLRYRPAHHAAYRDSWKGLGLEDADWKLLAQRSVEQAFLVETALCRVLDAIDEAGIADQTIVVVCADHGDAVASNGRVANKGSLLVEETVRIPMLLRGPGIPEQLEVPDAVTNLDITTTLLSLAELSGPDALPGRDLGSFLEPENPPTRPGVMMQHFGLHVPIQQRAWRSGNWKLIVQEDGFQELYDIGADPCEMTNLAGDPAHASVLRRLRRELLDEMRRVNDLGDRQSGLITALE